MKDKELKNIIGESFEDMSIVEMTKVQGSGDTEILSTPLTTSSVECAAGVTGIATAVSEVVYTVLKC